MTLSPLHIQFALVVHYSPDPLGALDESWESDAGKEIKKWLVDEGLLDWDLSPTYGTPRLAAWIDHLCKQPLPEVQWVIPS